LFFARMKFLILFPFSLRFFFPDYSKKYELTWYNVSFPFLFYYTTFRLVIV
jgi:hypothetical protein